jgi:hypothetical protein
MKVKLKDLKLTDLKMRETPKGVAWEAVLLHKNKPFIHVSNKGRGGNNSYLPANGMKNSELQVIIQDLENQAAIKTGFTVEALDHLTCIAQEGQYLAKF